MSAGDILERLGPAARAIAGRLERQVQLAPVTWFRVGGPAEVLFTPADEDDLRRFLAALPADVPVTVLGLASNTLVRDGGVRGVVIRLSAKGFGWCVAEGLRVTAGGAAPDVKIARAAADAGIAGLSFFRGVPGSIGGAIRMNAGAYGGETKDRLVRVVAVDRAGERRVLTPADLAFGYRRSALPEDVIVTEATFEGVAGDRSTILAEMDEITARREATQPIRERTGGSTFKNPDGQKAWELIDRAGCRGLRVGGAMMSDQHCNFMVNAGGATAADLEILGETVRRRVRDTTGVSLDWEIRRVGVLPAGVAVSPFMEASA